MNAPTTPEPAPHTSFGKRVLLAAVVLAIMLLVAELVIRAVVSEPVPIRFAQDTSELRQLQLNRFHLSLL